MDTASFVTENKLEQAMQGQSSNKEGISAPAQKSE